jgi:hypothetical protein
MISASTTKVSDRLGPGPLAGSGPHTESSGLARVVRKGVVRTAVLCMFAIALRQGSLSQLCLGWRSVRFVLCPASRQTVPEVAEQESYR